MKLLLAFTVATAILLSTVGEAKAWIHGTKQDVDNNHCPAWQDGTPVTIPTVQAYMNSKHPGHGYYRAQISYHSTDIEIDWVVRGVFKYDFIRIINTCPL